MDVTTLLIILLFGAFETYISGDKWDPKVALLFGLAAFAADLKAMILTGINVKPDACKHKNMICALEATDLFGLISCKLSIAFNPKGVAALSNPSKLAEKFIIICPIAG